tara:strand:+ start:1973 stop:2287 length:315 start_codon:yes stop_codon:yes gene_type:complete
MKFIKWILGLLAGIGGIIALFVGNKSNEKVKELKDDIKDNEKKTKDIDSKLKDVKETSDKLKKNLEKEKSDLKELEKEKESINPEKKSADKAHSRLKEIGRGKK